MTIISFLANIKLKISHFVVLVITSLRDPVVYAEPSQPGALALDQKVYPKNFSQQPAMEVCIPGSAVALPAGP